MGLRETRSMARCRARTGRTDGRAGGRMDGPEAQEEEEGKEEWVDILLLPATPRRSQKNKEERKNERHFVSSTS